MNMIGMEYKCTHSIIKSSVPATMTPFSLQNNTFVLFIIIYSYLEVA